MSIYKTFPLLADIIMAKTFLDADMDAELEELEKDNEDSDDDMSDDDDEEDEEEKEDPEVLKQISSYQEELLSNPYNYNAHLQLVTLLRKTDNFNELRAARKSFSEHYPLTAELYIDWVNDELKIASTEEEKRAVEELFEKGVKDYVSVDLWLEYCQHSIGGIGTAEGVTKARNIFERALTFVGRHVARGSLVWEAFREFEAVMLSMISDKESKAYKDQKQKVVNVYKRQLRVPLIGLETTLAEFREFLQGEALDKNIEIEFNKAKKQLETRQVFEDKISKSEDTMEAYLEYLQFELKEKDPVMIQQLYERAITSNCLVDSLWSDYLTYLDTSIRIPEVSVEVYKRAVRNVPWCLEVWCNYLRGLERWEQPHSEVRTVFEQALSAGIEQPGAYLELWLCYLDYMRRKTVWEKEVTESMSELRNTFEKANAHLAKVKDDPGYQVSKYWANLEADQFGMMDNARKIWSEITSADPFKASTWLEYIQLEKIFGDKKHLRKAYQRAVEKTYDDPEAVIKSFIQFEREEGSLDAFDHAKKLCRIKMEKVTAAREKENNVKAEEEKLKQEKIEKKKEKDKQYRRDKRQQTAADKKASMESNTFTKPMAPPPAPASSSKAVAPPPGFPGTKKSVPPPPGFNENNKRTIAPPPGFKEPNPKKQKLEEFEQLSEEDQKKHRTVFISNLDYSVKEEDLRACLQSSGSILDVRLVRKPTGESKGFAFVEFENYAEALEALKRDNELISGRPMYISECDPERKSGPVFKYETGLEKNKLFISSLAQDVTRAELIQVFEKFGKLREVRIPVYRNGHSKGIAFVDYEDEVSAATALVKADNMMIKNKAIKVALSNPPKRKNEDDSSAPASSSKDVRSLGGTDAKDFGPRGKGRSQLAFTPRSVSVPAKPAAKLEPMKFVKAKDHSNGSSNGSSNGDNSSSKSNSDFRKLLGN